MPIGSWHYTIRASAGEAHIRHWEDSFCRLQRYNLKLNLKKCIFAAPEIKYLGYTISAGSIKLGKEKTQTVREFPAPTQ